MKLKDIKDKAGFKFFFVDDSPMVPYMILDQQTHNGHLSFVSLDNGSICIFGAGENILEQEVYYLVCDISA